MDEVHVIRHADVCITCAEIRLQFANLFECKGLYRLIISMKRLLHILVDIVLVHRHEFGIKAL